MKTFLLLLLSFSALAQIPTVISTSSNGGTPEPAATPFVIVDNAVKGDQGYQHDYSVVGDDGVGIEGWYPTEGEGLLGTLWYTNTTNATIDFTFNGTKVYWYTETKNTHGIVGVSIDGGAEDMVDLYAASPTQQVLVFESDPLSQGVHTITLRCTGTKNASSSQYYLIHDYFKVDNPQEVPETPDPEPFDRHVKTDGVDTGDCSTVETSCLTLGYTFTQSDEGDKIRMYAGTFIEPAYLVPPVGVSIWGEGIDTTIVRVNSSLNANVALDKTKFIFQYTTEVAGNQSLKHLTIEGNSKLVHGGVYIERDNVDLDFVKIINVDYCGYYVKGDDHSLTNSIITNCSEDAGSFSLGAIMIDQTNDLIIDNLDLSESEGYGVKSFGGQPIIDGMQVTNSSFKVAVTSPANIAFEIHNSYPRNCLFEGNYFDGSVSFIRPTSFNNDAIPSVHVKNNVFDMITKGSGTAVAAPLELGVHNALVEENIFVGGRFAYIVHWNADESEAAENWTVQNNVFYCVQHVNSPTGIFRSNFAPFNGLYVYNNTFHIPTAMNLHTNMIFTGSGVTAASNNVNITNNIWLDESTADTGVGGANTLFRNEGSGSSATFNTTTVNYNLIFGMPVGSKAGVTYSNNLTSDPELIGSGVNATPFIIDPFYRPDTGSPAIESGTDVGLPFNGAAPTRGRFEQQ